LGAIGAGRWFLPGLHPTKPALISAFGPNATAATDFPAGFSRGLNFPLLMQGAKDSALCETSGKGLAYHSTEIAL